MEPFHHINQNLLLQYVKFASSLNDEHNAMYESTPGGRVSHVNNNQLCLTRVAHNSLKTDRVGTVVRALASHQCDPGSNPGPGVICGLSLLLVLALL